MLSESKIIYILNVFIHKIVDYYKESFLAKIVNAISEFIAKLLGESFILSLFTRKNKSSFILRGLKMDNVLIRWLKNSIFFKIIDFFNARYLFEILYVFSLVFLPTAFSIAFSLIILLNSIYRIMQYGAKFTLTHIYIMIFTCILLVSAIYSIYVENALLVSITYILYLSTLVLMTACIKDKKEVITLMYTAILVLAICILYGFYQSVVGVSVDPAWVDEEMFKNTERIFSFFHNPNVYGIFLVILLPTCIGLFLQAKNKLVKFVLTGIFFAGIINIFLTMSRGSMVGIAIALFFMAVFIDKRFFLLAIIALLIAPFVLPSSIINRLLSIGNLKETSSAYRISIYIASLAMIKDFFIAGVGLGSFKSVYHSYALSASKSFHAHNTFLMVFAENGLFAFIFFLLFLISFTRDSLSCVLQSNKKEKFIVLGMFAGIIGASVQGLFEHIWHNYDILFIYFLFITLASSLSSLIQSEAENE